MSRSEQTPVKFRVELNWKLALFALLLLPLLVGLGVWQLQRAEEKRTIQESWQRQQALPPVEFSANNLPQQGLERRVMLRGQFDSEHYWLLENQITDGRLGYHVIMPFRLAGTASAAGPVVLVNRGWVPMGAYRTELPDVETPKGLRQITGSLAAPSTNRLVDEMGDPPSHWPARIITPDLEAMTKQLRSAGYNVAPYDRLLRIDEDSPGALVVNWQPVNMSPATHRGYAVQWFALAAALVILSLFANSNLADVLFRRQRGKP